MARRRSHVEPLVSRGEAVARRFAERLIDGDLDAAYGMTSGRLRARLSPEQFAAEHRAAWARHGRPRGVIQMDGVVGEDLNEPGSGYPQDVPADERVARVAVSLEPGPEDRGRPRAGCDLWVNVGTESGVDVVESFEYDDLDL